MIGWNVDIGYLTGTTTPTSLNQISWTDYDRPWTIPTSLPKSEIAISSNYLTEDYVTKLANFMIDNLQNDYYTIYSVPNNTVVQEDGGQIIRKIVPSTYLGYPNLINYFKTNYSSAILGVGIFFKSLSKLLLISVGSNRFTRVYSVSDGNLSVIYSQNSSYITNTFFDTSTTIGGNHSLRLYGILNYDKDINLIDNSFGIISIETATGNGINSYISQGIMSGRNLSHYVALFNNEKPDFDIISPPNPYEPGGPSGPTDPDLPPGTFDDTSDPIPDSPLPTISAADTGFTRIYNPTLSQVKALAQYLWTTPDVIATIWNHIKQFFENPMDAIIGFNLVPVHVPDGGTTNFKLMYIDTGVAMTAAANQFVDVDCGTLEVKRYYGSALDQSPYTKVSCFLPYIGTVQLNTDEVMGATLQVKYRVDICSGSCVAKIFIDGNCIYQYSGHCAINIPISSADFSSYVSAAINVAKLAIGAATAGAGGAAMAGAQVAGTEQQTGNMAALQTQGGSSPNLSAIYQGQSQQQPPSQSTTSASFAGISPANISNTVGEIMNAKPHVEHSGSFSGNTGYLGVRRPFIIIERPNMCMPENYQALNGFPAMITMELSTCKGFTRVQQVQLTGMTATNPEQAEILELLKSGVIL